MEVSGKIGVQISKLSCRPCEREGLEESVYGYCKDCHEHLCETCYKHHRRALPSINHILLDKDSMPKVPGKVSKAPEDMTDFCQNHQDKRLEFYCKNHKSVSCYVCVTLEHKHCQVDYIPDISGNMSDEINDIFQRTEELIKKCNSSIDNADMAAQNIKQKYMKIMEDIRIFRNEINGCLDLLEAKMIRKVDEFVENSKRTQNKLKAVCLDITEELSCSQSLMNTLKAENKLNNLFIQMKNAELRLPVLTSKEKEVSEENDIDKGIKYTRNTSLIDSLKTENAFGQLTIISMDRAIDMQYAATIDVKSPSDTNECNITGLVMITPSKMVAADSMNNSIKLIDVEKCSLITETKTSSLLSDVALLQENKIAVTLIEEKCIQIVSYTETKLSPCYRINVGEYCSGAAYSNDKLVVSCYRAKKIITVSVTGEILDTLDLQTIMCGPARVVISNDEKYLYVTDTNFKETNKVVKIDMEGNVKYIFDEQDYKVPWGIQQLEDGTFLVCYGDSHTLLRLSNSCRECKIVGLKKEKLFYPKALTYREEEQKLYVSFSSKAKSYFNKSDLVKVFNVTWQ